VARRRRLKLTGIFSEKTSRRVYPAGLAGATSWLRRCRRAGARRAGAQPRRQLAGRDGRRSTRRGGRAAHPAGANAEQAPVDGSDVQLTIDKDIQWYAEQQLRAKVKETKSASGYAIVYDCRNGDILAMATTPGFDPAKAGAAPRRRGRTTPWPTRTSRGAPARSSPAAAVIEERAAKPGTPITVPNRLRRGGDSFKDFREHGVEKLTYAGTIAKSSNIGTILAAEKLPGGLPTMWKYFDRFGLGHPTGSGLPSENPGSVPHPDTWSATSGYTMAFGQGYSVNALQMVNAYGTICNDGVRITPRIVAGWRAPDGTFTPAPVGKPTRVVSPATAKTVRTMMEGVLGEGGTAPLARIPGTASAARPAPRTGTTRRSAGTAATPCPSWGSPPPTRRGSSPR
jgi:cell division protein FtsI (penicillin-binding protein 3)